MGSFLKLQQILAQMVSGATKAASGDKPTESDDTENGLDDMPTVADTGGKRLAHSRNRVPTLIGPYLSPYGMVLPSRGWMRT